MRSFVQASLLVLSGATAAAAQSPAAAQLDAAIDAYVAPLQALDVLDGIVVIAENGRVLTARTYGFANREFGIANEVDGTFRIASISKPFTRILVGRLMEGGVLAVEDAVARWLPEFPQAERITIRMLLEHRAGVPSRNSLPWDEEALAQPTLAQLVDSIAAMPLDFEPGTEARYSNGGYAVLARILELASGRSYAELIAAEVAAPLGLRATRHEADGDIVPRLALGYMPSPLEPRTMVRAPFQSMDTKTGGGSLVSSAADLIAMLRAIRRDPVLAPATWDALFPARERIAYQGRAPGFNVFAMHDVARDRSVVVLLNNYAAGMVGDVAEAAAALADGAEPRPLAVRAPVEPDSSDLPFLEGAYRLPDGFFPGDPPLTIEDAGGYLVVRIGGAPVDVLVPQGGRAFLSRALWSIVTFDGAAGTRSGRIDVRALYNDSRFEARRES